MTSDGKLRGLGRGLSALLGDETAEDARPGGRDAPPRTVPIEHLRPSRFQPRRRIAEDDLRELADSIAARGVLQPILARPDPEQRDRFEIIAGERRWRASQLARLHEVPVIVREFSDGEALEVALIENLQRQDLSPLEEAEGYRRLMEEYAHTQEDLAKVVGKSRSHVANTMRLLGLPEPIKRLVEEGLLSAGHARALLGAAEPEALARRVLDRGLNVRQTEQLVGSARADGDKRRRPAAKDADTLALERDLGNALGLSVEIRFSGSRGSLVLYYTSLDQLDDILHRLSRGTHGRRADTHREERPGAERL
jgi:ParB family transcriptional regulator, chromosome partitioning protein